ncbi:MAG TPA: hypothetical protein ACFYD6_00540 [Candidatus Brocadiia bacterium]|nr:hypothetical protein [Planctomycetota bacterium]MBI4008421.1 hypothetical protein [Planctomycetota bacterium]MDO8094082.1 hypothetical protein [Candidatus Brocadiales bacterium]
MIKEKQKAKCCLGQRVESRLTRMEVTLENILKFMDEHKKLHVSINNIAAQSKVYNALTWLIVSGFFGGVIYILLHQGR